LAQEGEILGYTRAIFSGVTTDELARVIRDYVLPDPDLSGVWHVSGEPISKHDLLVLARDALHHAVRIKPYGQFVIDRSLNSQRFRERTGYQPPAWPEMIRQLTADASLYERP
jgi:dTDP-4-dehydrorhamnose reductase